MSFTPRNHIRPFVHNDHKSDHCDNRSDGYSATGTTAATGKFPELELGGYDGCVFVCI